MVSKDDILAKMEVLKFKSDEPYFGIAYSLKKQNDKELFMGICRNRLTTLERIDHLKRLMLNNVKCAKLDGIAMEWLEEYRSSIENTNTPDGSTPNADDKDVNNTERKDSFRKCLSNARITKVDEIIDKIDDVHGDKPRMIYKVRKDFINNSSIMTLHKFCDEEIKYRGKQGVRGWPYDNIRQYQRHLI